ncbi:MAG: c-type cytochrome [Candidatus Eremiobacteraeota bacterium]|nr:c-type cytochrome [Candidatus Eremiobacteraeota bacterium]
MTSLLLWVRDGAQAAAVPRGETLVRNSDCLSCHAVDHKVVGPAFVSVAKRYAGQKDAASKLVAKVRSGGSGNWGSVAMTPHSNISTADLTCMVTWVLSLRGSKTPKPATSSAAAKTYSYTLNGKKVVLDFPVFISDHVVTRSVFSGYQLFDAYCFRCHGPDAVGGELAPDLRVSLQQGLTHDQFISTALAGRPGKGMPSWAGFFSRAQLEDIYRYVKARSTGLVATGRPAGE